MTLQDEWQLGTDLTNGLPSRIHLAFEAGVGKWPNQPALVEAGRSWTYSEFSEAVASVSEKLSSAGVRPGDRLLIAAENSVLLAALIFAAGKLDAWAIPTNPRLSARELDQIYVHSGARIALFGVGISTHAASHATRHNASVGDLGPFSEVGISPVNQDTSPEPVKAEGSEQVAVLIYTSGTTGQPKGVMLSHRNLLYTARVTGTLRRLGNVDRVYGVLPMSHIVGCSSVLIASLMFGSTVYVEPKYDPELFLEAIVTRGITVVYGVPATYQRLLAFKSAKALRQLPRGKLRFLGVSGAPLDLDLKHRIEREFELPLLNGYGITECSPGISNVRIDDPRDDETVGTIMPGIEARVVRLDGSNASPCDIGELHVRGPNVMLGYYKDPELTTQAIDHEGWFNTGDLAKFVGKYLFVVGRTKEMIIRSGFNVYPAEVEGVLNSHPLVAQSAVVGRAIDGNEEVVAFVQLMPGAEVAPQQLVEFAGQHLTGYKRPSRIVVLDALPAGSTGKILKRELWEAAREG